MSIETPTIGVPETAAPPAGLALPSKRRISRRSMRFRLALTGLVIIGALGYLVVEGLGNALVYFRTVNQALASRAQLGTSNFRLEGTVVQGSVKPEPGGVDFSLEAGGDEILVQNQGSPPQLFAAGIPVVVVGHLTADASSFMSNQIMVKHSASYTAAYPKRVRGDPK